MKYILGKKLKTTQMFDAEGKIVPVTLVEAGPCFVLQLKGKEKDGYSAVQIGYEELVPKKIKKPLKSKPYRHIREFDPEKEYKIGDMIDISIFSEGEKIKVSGISKGKGFAGAVKKWGFRGRSSTHGTKHEERTIGSTGCRFPQRVIKGRKMAGRMGSERVTVKNLKIQKIDLESNILAIKGAVPGRKGTLLEIRI
ncbi:MAG: 50S ribosomal protein L3 [Candidatus Nealsonbacteria bacterium RIFOXYB1_FULL_40_15]|uniref:50S ribosomal protein L3 n=2 Tax=Candidatus Nealsoniibacteriota TaxID=1817911 RepID=A0A1G2ELL5_9BACT|nr:MAG: 50S ribosomal protein L3 [Candidatus Nealsonbacteria bacterium RIFOXYC1_FULL_40_7]OGZ27822.1 MAG: 50S ribosomal protein L3 [Candidatus Nealsonbacteria bacterium RIFOXYB1_FULL_40_15]OGZ28926.1 MAG: 50S ribosomal protein L3 [Candidatus Nealsonbacteria bacterium RIFOXYD1_FULL_39_11]